MQKAPIRAFCMEFFFLKYLDIFSGTIKLFWWALQLYFMCSNIFYEKYLVFQLLLMSVHRLDAGIVSISGVTAQCCDRVVSVILFRTTAADY